MSTLRVDNLNARTGTTISVPTGTKLYAPGHIIQVVQTVKSDVFSTASQSFIDLTGMSVNITPTSTSSKILVEYSVQTSIVNGGYGCMLKLMRNGSDLSGAQGQGGGSAATTIAFSDGATYSYYPVYNQTMKYLDSPSSNSLLTYKLQISGWQASAGTVYVNRSYAGISASLGTSISTITVTEIGA